VNKRIVNAKFDNVEPDDKKYKAAIFINPMKDWHLRSSWEEGIRTGGPIKYVRLFTFIGIFVLLLACINFMNLSTARSEKRAKEVGIRKAIGSLRSQLIKQFFCESLLVVALSFLVSIVLVQLILPWFNDVANKKMAIPWMNPVFWSAGLAFALLTGLIAGSYPALYLSSFEPIKVLKGTFRVGRFAAVPRKVLVVLQFTVSIALIIGTVVVYRQIQHSKDRPIGYNRDGLMMVMMSSPEFYGKYDALRTELKQTGAIVEMAESSSPVTGVWSNNGGYTWEGKDPNLDSDFATIWVTHEFGKTVGWEFVQGRDISRDFATDSSALVINEAAVKFMNLKDPVGKVVTRGENEKLTIVGVIKDMVMQSPYEPVKQSFYMVGPDNVNWINLKLNPNKSTHESIAKIEAVFKKMVPNAPFDYKFADEEYANKFAAEERIGKLAGFFAMLAVLISCLGLFGLASFVAERRTKEIGVRKVLGASVFNVWGLLSKEFVMLVIISCFIAIPVAYYYLHEWLQQYQYRTTITWWIMAGAVMGAFFITIVTVSYQAIKAAIANPIKSLRTE
jgi:ABC-type antimicrobial peptide transport system permease subunit